MLSKITAAVAMAKNDQLKMPFENFFFSAMFYFFNVLITVKAAKMNKPIMERK